MTTFDEWWATLTPAEKKVIGRTNAKYVWFEACAAEREACLKIAEEYAGVFGRNYSEIIADTIRARGRA